MNAGHQRDLVTQSEIKEKTWQKHGPGRRTRHE